MILELAIVQMGHQRRLLRATPHLSPPAVKNVVFQPFKLVGEHCNLDALDRITRKSEQNILGIEADVRPAVETMSLIPTYYTIILDSKLHAASNSHFY